MKFKINECKYDIKEFIKNNICTEFKIDYWDEWLEEQDYNSLQKSPNILISVEENNDLIGTCAVKEITKEECSLNTFYIKKEYRNKGIGKKIFDMCMEHIKENGYKKVILTVDPKFEVAKKFYEKNGFIYKSKNEKIQELYYYKNI